MNELVVLDKKTKRKGQRIWELDFLRGICILLMCVDHFFYDIYDMYRSWGSSSNGFLKGLYGAADFYRNGVELPAFTIELAEYVFLSIIFLAVVISFVVKYIKYRKGIGESKEEIKKRGINYAIALGGITIAIISMVILNRIYGFAASVRNSVRDFVHPIVLCIFFTLCGQSCRFSRNNVVRTLQIAICAALITIVTYLAGPIFGGDLTVRFGVLHMLATAVAVYTVIELIFKFIVKDPNKRKYFISVTCLVVGIISYFLYQYIRSIYLTPSFSRNDSLAWLHEAFKLDFTSSDYFPLLEHLHKIMFGCAIAPFVYPDKKSLMPKLQNVNKGAVCFFGRNTLWVVLLHQPVISGILYVMSLIIK